MRALSLYAGITILNCGCAIALSLAFLICLRTDVLERGRDMPLFIILQLFDVPTIH